MAADDVRIARWDLRATAGTTVSRPFTSDTAITTLSVYTGGTVTDVDDLTGATAHAATVDGDGLGGTVEIDVPEGSSVPLRLVIDGAVVAVGRLTPSTTGATSRDDTVTIAVAESSTLTLELPSIVVNEGGGGGGTDDQTAAEVAFTPTGSIAATDVQSAIAEVSDEVTTEAATRAAADTALDGRLDTIEADYTTAAEVSASVTAAIDALVAGAPGALDTLNELAAAIGDDADYAATITAALADKQPLDPVLTATTASFTTADETKLDGIEPGATADQTAAEVAITDTGGYYTGTDVEAALQEVGADLASAGGGSIVQSHPMTSDIVALPGWALTDASSNLTCLGNYIIWWPFIVDAPITVTDIDGYCTTAVASTSVRFAIAPDNSGAPGGTLVYGSGTLDTTTTGHKSVTGLSLSMAGGRYWVGITSNGAPVFQAHKGGLRGTTGRRRTASVSSLYAAVIENVGSYGAISDPYSPGTLTLSPTRECPVLLYWTVD